MISFLISLVLPTVPLLNPIVPTPKIDRLPQQQIIKAAPKWESVTVVKVYDGDTFTGIKEGVKTRYRVTWVNTPELKTKQFYAKEATAILTKILAEGKVEVQIVGKSFDRDVAHIRTSKTSSVGLELVKQGAGVAYPTCNLKCPETWAIVKKAEALAKKLKLGIWQKPPVENKVDAFSA